MARLLQDGDTITVIPHLIFTFTQFRTAGPCFGLPPHQRREALHFEDRYVITDRTIGSGGHALVYLATEVETGRQVACKVHNLRRSLWADQKVQRIRKEATLLSYLDHVIPLSFLPDPRANRGSLIFSLSGKRSRLDVQCSHC